MRCKQYFCVLRLSFYRSYIRSLGSRTLYEISWCAHESFKYLIQLFFEKSISYCCAAAAAAAVVVTVSDFVHLNVYWQLSRRHYGSTGDMNTIKAFHNFVLRKKNSQSCVLVRHVKCSRAKETLDTPKKTTHTKKTEHIEHPCQWIYFITNVFIVCSQHYCEYESNRS